MTLFCFAGEILASKKIVFRNLLFAQGLEFFFAYEFTKWVDKRDNHCYNHYKLQQQTVYLSWLKLIFLSIRTHLLPPIPHTYFSFSPTPFSFDIEADSLLNLLFG